MLLLLQCPHLGMFCKVQAGERCQFCTDRVPFPPLSLDLSRPLGPFNTTAILELCSAPREITGYVTGGGANIEKPDFLFKAATVRSWCDACVHGATGDVDRVDGTSFRRWTFNSMQGFDWAALVLASYFVALSAVGELKGVSAANYDSSFSQPPPDEGRDLFLCAAWQETTSVASLLCGG